MTTAELFKSSTLSYINTVALAASALITGAVVGTLLVLHQLPATAQVLLILVFAADILLILNFYKLDVTFDGRQLTFAYGLLRKKIPLSEIVEAEPLRVKWSEFGGTGIRAGRGVRAWVTGNGPAIQITTTSGARYVANCEKPEALVELITSFGHNRGQTK